MDPLERVAAVAAQPDRLDDLSDAELDALAGELERLRAGVWRRLTRPSEPSTNGRREPDTEDRLIDVNEAAEILDVDPRWLYDRSDSLPFARKLAPRTLRFSRRGLHRWLERRP